MEKKAQIRMFEMLAVLIIFLVLLSIGAVFYFRMQHSSVAKEIARAESLHSFELFQKMSYLPELDCSFRSITKDNCFDVIKLKEFSTLLESEEMKIDYFDVFGFSTVKIKKIYPFVGDWFVLYSNFPQDYSSKQISYSTVLLYNASSDFYDLGIVEVSFYGE